MAAGKRGAKVPYRVIQWATGKVGNEGLRQIIDHPDLELSGVYVFSEGKVGMDAGDICGRPTTGIRATNRIEDLLTVDADIILHTPMRELTSDNSDREVLALLKSGKNVISVRGYYWPRWLGEDYERQFLEACQHGNATLHANGISPGFIYDRLAPTMSSFCQKVRAVYLNEYFDLRLRPWHTIYDVCGLATTPGELTPEHPTAVSLNGLYTEMYHLMAEHWETKVKSVSLRFEYEVTDHDITIESGVIPAGTCRGNKWIWEVDFANGVFMRSISHYYIDPIPGWEHRNVWKIEIDGEPKFVAEMPLEETGADTLTTGGYDPNGKAIIALSINAIPEVIAAPPGVLKATVFAPWRARFR